MRKEKFSGRY